MQTLQQQMAITALQNIRQVEAGDKQKYGTMAHKLPMLIRNAGLVQALAFVEARGEEAQKQLVAHLAQTINFEGVSDIDDLTRLSREADLATYMLLTRRVMSALLWYKRFTETVLKVSNLSDSSSASVQANSESGGEQ